MNLVPGSLHRRIHPSSPLRGLAVSMVLFAGASLTMACEGEVPREPGTSQPDPGSGGGNGGNPTSNTGGNPIGNVGGGTPSTGGGPVGTGGTGPGPHRPGPIADDVTVSVSGRQILVNGQPLHIRGVNWNPVAKGADNDANFGAFAATDIALMKDIGVNVVRTYRPLSDHAVLDQLKEAGIFVLYDVYSYGGSDADVAINRVNAVKDHPAILMWVVGNEWNYNGLYVGLTHQQSIDRINQVAQYIRNNDPSRPIASVYGQLPLNQTISAMPNIDVWGTNVYQGLGFGDLFQDWAGRSNKPLFISEYGADAWNSNSGSYDPDSQAHATKVLTELIVDNSAVFSNGVVSGGVLFEWADEWWKAGNPDSHDVGGVAPGGGPHPDHVFNEEWWGIVDIDRNVRPAYYELGNIYKNLGQTPGTVPGSP